MLNRRNLILLTAALSGPVRAFAASGSGRLQTRMFNFKDDAPQSKTAEIVAAMQDIAKSSDIGGFLIGRNFIPDPFPNRFEWLYMIQIDDFAANAQSAAYRRFEHLRDELSSYCRNAVECDLAGPTSPRFADAAGVKVRHTVMFDLKPEASLEDQARNVDAIREMGKLPMVKSYRVERSATYAADPTQMQWQVIGDFASVDDYWAYAKAPVHLAIRDDFKAHTSRVAFLDVEL
jgi:hypothetical protein